MKISINSGSYPEIRNNVENICSEFITAMRKAKPGDIVSVGNAVINNGFLRQTSNREQLAEEVEKTGRVNFYPGSLSIEEIGGMLTDFAQLPSEKHYAWVVLVRPVLRREALPLNNLEMDSSPPSESTVSEILDLWTRDYAHVTSHYPPVFAIRDTEGLKARIADGTNLVFRRGSDIVAHFCFKEVQHPVLGIPCQYWHQWVDRNLPTAARAAIHSNCFRNIDEHGLPAMSGVSIHNTNGMRHAIGNASVPMLLCIRRL